MHPDFCKILVCTKEYFEEKKVGFYKKMQHTGYLRHLLVRRAIKTGEILVDLITTTQTDTFEGTTFTGMDGAPSGTSYGGKLCGHSAYQK